MRKYIIIIIVLLSGPADPCRAAYDLLGWGARPMGMGGAYTAICDDANAVFWNPAGIARLKHGELIDMYSRLYTGLDLQVWDEDVAGYEPVDLGTNYLAAACPAGNAGSFGFGITSFRAPGLYFENMYAFNYARQVMGQGEEEDRRRRGTQVDLYTGLNLKWLRRGYVLDDRTSGDVVFTDFLVDGSSVAARGRLNADIGCVAVIDSQITVGLSVSNLFFSNLAMEDGVSDTLSPEVRLGCAYEVARDITPELDISLGPAGLNAHLGCEAWFLAKTIGVRAGGNLDGFGMGMSFRKLLESVGFQIDYSLVYPFRVSDSWGTHRVSCSIQFDEKLYLEVVEEQKKLGRREQKDLAKQYFSRGVDYYKAGKYKKAIMELNKVLALVPDHSKSAAIIEKAREKLGY